VQRRHLLVLALALGLLSPFVVATAPALGSASVSLALSPPEVTYGEKQQASGVVTADAPCAAGRTVDLQQKPPGGTIWAALDTTTSGSDGSYALGFTPHSNAAYRVVVESVGGGVTCNEVDSSVVKGRVLAFVGLTLGKATAMPGECAQAALTVQPDKQGQHVRLEQQGGKGWSTVQTLTLSSSSTATASLCEGWSDVGKRMTFRATWPKQDALNAAGSSDTSTLSVVAAPWMQRIDRIIHGRAVGVSIRANGSLLYAREQNVAFAPASNEKLLLSMAMLDRLGPQFRIETDAAAASVSSDGVVHGNLWILGHGDPSIGKPDMTALAKAIARAGVRAITGHVMGGTGYFARDWFAPGWLPNFPTTQVALPSALTFRENTIGGKNVGDPEVYAAASLTRHLKRVGVKVRGRPGSGAPRGNPSVIARIHSPILTGLMTHMDQLSDNFYAEDLGKRLGLEVYGSLGTIANGARAISAWTSAHGVVVHVHDSSGLSYENRVTPAGMTTLLQYASTVPWGDALRELLPDPSQGTMKETHNLHGVQVHAKTGTLDIGSALSGWVWLKKLHTWAEFSILDRGMCSCASKPMEDAIVRTVFKSGH
jgi:D-alanyl-D-alanine carboxypeptidase